MTTQINCDICDQDQEELMQGVCEGCWIESAMPGGVYAELPLTLLVEGDSTACEDLTLGEFMADNPEELSAEDIVTLLGLLVGESITLGGGAAPMFWLGRREGEI